MYFTYSKLLRTVNTYTVVVPGFGHARALSTYHDILGRILVHVAFNSFNDLQNHMPRRDHGRGLAQVRLYGYLIVEKGL